MSQDYERSIAELREQVSELETELLTLLIETRAKDLAREMTAGHAAYADLLLPAVRGRLAVEVINGKREITYRDADGRSTLLQPEEQLRADDAYRPFLRTAAGAPPPGLTQDESRRMSRMSFDALPPADRTEFIRIGGTLYDAECLPSCVEKSKGALTRAEFDELAPAERIDRIRSGATIVD